MSINQAGFEPIVPGARRWDFLGGLMQQLGYKTFVEVGCKEGRTTGHILKTIPDAEVVAIDPWCTQAAGDDPTRETYEKWDFGKIADEFAANVEGNGVRVHMMMMTSLEAAPRVQADHGQVDLVFIDALHDYASVIQDIDAWWPLVRDRGILAGHDFNHKWPGVQAAVAEKFNLMRVGVGPDSVWFVMKSKELDGGT